MAAVPPWHRGICAAPRPLGRSRRVCKVSFAALAARLGLSPGRPADIGRCQRGGDDENELAHGRFRQSDMRVGRTIARTSTGRRDDKLEEDLEFSCRISGDWGKGRPELPTASARPTCWQTNVPASRRGGDLRAERTMAHRLLLIRVCIGAVVARYRPGIGCVLAIQSRQAR